MQHDRAGRGEPTEAAGRAAESAQRTVQRAGAYVQERAGRATERARDLSDRARELARDAARIGSLEDSLPTRAREARAYLRGHPLQALAVVLVLGYVLGRLVRRG
jgi:ElaB/YqjD/DUF883 family membrane-anchored ribosome-binding protein